jgi:transaldolase / glucose-6-phosphate isomerase
MSRVDDLHNLGQSVWYDNIQRSLLENGELAKMIDQGLIRGVTSNPTIFHNAIAKSNDYEAALKPMAWAGWSANQIFTQLAVEDIRAAADLFRSVYNDTQRGDGYVSLEVSPLLAHDTSGTIAEARRLWNLVDRPNLMIKIPATQEGIPAIRETIAAGINVNVTLIFSLVRYAEVIDAFMQGLEDRVAKKLTIEKIASVASFFVSRVDSKVDGYLEDIIKSEEVSAQDAQMLLGKAAIANARLAYALFHEKFSQDRFKRLKAKGANLQRPLWASTSTKNPAYRDVIYVEELLGADTVNTMPPQTLQAFVDHGDAALKLSADTKEEQETIERLEALGISMEQVTAELETEGVTAFADAFNALIDAIEKRRISAVSELGELRSAIPAQIVRLEHEQVIERIFSIDPTLWTDDQNGQKEIQERLGWLVSPQSSQAKIRQYTALAEACRRDGMTHALLLGMGGSSLAPEVFRLVFGVGKLLEKKAFDLAVLDSTDPEEVRAAENRAAIDKTLFIVSSKSGTTGEVEAFLDYFWAKAVEALGEKAGDHFIAITDPGTKLEKTAYKYGFRAILNGDPMVGGRYSALTAFGLFPAALIGMNLDTLLERGRRMLDQCLPGKPAGRNPGLVLGVILGTAAREGRDKLTILADKEVEAFGSWLEQLIAESTGKVGRGIIPVDLEPEVNVQDYGNDRLFVYVRLSGKKADLVEKIQAAGQPVLVFELKDGYDLGTEFYRWEMAMAVACVLLAVNGFDQPDVQDNKLRTIKKIGELRKTGSMEEGQPIWESPDGLVFGTIFDGLQESKNLKEVLYKFVRLTKKNDYIAVNAYVHRSDKNTKTLQKIRKSILKETGQATTLGFGPRFLHSTGQLHKGGSEHALFVQLTADPGEDMDIPMQGIRFSQLQRAQALGDLEALLNRGRRVIRIHLRNAKIEDLV